ncbi:hypothetical protein [Aminobacter sp. AP02]|uniref:hypothetical protein n=1 Tax=Aminobacter sp. AP02 TaxID=2135737 RepID=UPI000D6A8946|nr:hypothetical protein [Aminobacter sp. AP02]PWK75667.1 hypothetical protein C8K44_103235 [Aminobacter sp. AP02]
MNTSRKFRIYLVAATAAFLGLGALERPTMAGLHGFSLVSSAEARVGRPLTPVSVAGVARRTARRCAVGVYYC